jgi:hypothetical protein
VVLAFLSTVLPQTPLPTILQLQADRQAALCSSACAAALREENAKLRQHLQHPEQSRAHTAGFDAAVLLQATGGRDEGVELKDLSSVECSEEILRSSGGADACVLRNAAVGNSGGDCLSELSEPGRACASLSLDEGLAPEAGSCSAGGGSAPVMQPGLVADTVKVGQV